MSVIKKEKRVSWLFERGIGYRRYCKEDNQEASFKGTSNTRCFSDGELGPYNPVGRNKLPKKSKRGQKKILERFIITKAIVSKKLFIRKKKQLRQV